MDAIFDSQAPVITSAVAAANRIQGIGGGDPGIDTSSRSQGGSYVSSTNSRSVQQDVGQSYTGHSGASGPMDINSRNYDNQTGTYNQSSGSSRLQGFGNPNFADRGQSSNGLASTASSLAQSAASMLVAAAGDFAGRVNSGTFTSDSASNYTSQQYVPQTLNAAYTTTTTQTQNVWGSAVQKTSPSGTVLPDIPVQPSGLGRAGSAADDGSYESQLLETLCEAGGLKTALNEEQLKSFLNVAPTLNAQIVGASLSALLNHDAWQTRTKALMLIAILVQHKDCDAHFEYWQTNSEEISGLLGDPKAAVRAQAIKALQAAMVELDAETIKRAGGSVQTGSGSQEKPGKSSTTTTKIATQLSLLDLTDDSPSTNTSTPVPASVPVSMPVAVYAVSPAPSLDFFDGLSAPTTPSVASVSSQLPPPQQQQQQQQVSHATSSSPFDLLDGLSGGPSVAPIQSAPAPYDPFASTPAVAFASTTTPQAVATPQVPSTSTYDLSFLSNAAPLSAPVPTTTARQNRVDLNSLLSAPPAPTTAPYGMPPSVRPVGSYPVGGPSVSNLFFFVLTTCILFIYFFLFTYCYY